MSNNTGGPAFPAPAGVQHITEQGMTLRDWMAGMAMQALVKTNYFDSTAEMAYAMADAMLKAREASE